VEDVAISKSFNAILRAAHMNRGGDDSTTPLARRSKSRRHDSGSFVLNNITSLLSPSNMKKIERSNLYS